MPNNTEGGHAIFVNFQQGSWTNKRLRTPPRGFLPLLCVHIAVLLITDISHLTPTSYTWKQHNNPELTDVDAPLPYLLLSDLEYSGCSATAERFLATAKGSRPKTQSRNKDLWPCLSSRRRHPVKPTLAWAPSMRQHSKAHFSHKTFVRVIWWGSALKAISYSENHLSWTICRKQSHFKPFPGRKELTTGSK